MTPLARVEDELRGSVAANMVVGDAGAIAAAIAADNPGTALVYWLVVTAGVGIVWAFVGAGKLRGQAARATAAPEDGQVDARSRTYRRVLLGVLPIALVVAAAAVIAPDSAAVIAGVPAGVGAAELSVLRWLRARQAERADVLLRPPPRSPFSGGDRPVYTRPMNELTEPT